jgi:hypothetical protein
VSASVRIAFASIASLVTLSAAVPARAQSTTVRSGVDAETIEIDGTVTLTLQAQSSTGNAPEDPSPGPHAGFTVLDFTQAPTQMLTIINGRRSDQHGLVATWVLRPSRLGTFTLGPPTVTIGGVKHGGRPARITVVPHGKAPRPPVRGLPQLPAPFGRAPLGGGKPFDPFKALFDDDDAPTFRQPEVETDPSLALDAPRGHGAFLHATVDRKRVVVGEQVTHVVYLYTDPQAPAGSPHDVHEATAKDFVKRSLEADDTHLTGVGNALVGGRVWTVQRVRRNALFPLKGGRLTIEPMSLAVGGRRMPSSKRESETLEVDVTEPPITGRPPGYVVGDVGAFALDATVDPREIEEGGAIGVTLEIRGLGNPPHKLSVPVMPGVEWLEPQIREKVGAAQGDRFGGTRTFSYVVRMQRPGTIDLGAVTFPHFDPTTRMYAIARASIGKIVVRPNGRDAGTESEAATEVLAGMPEPRRILEGAPERSFVADRGVFWVGLFGAPLAAIGVIGASGALRRAAAKRKDKATSPDTEAKARMREAQKACDEGDGAAALGAVTRALEASVLARTGVNLRGGSAEAMGGELRDAGVDDETVTELLAVRRACEDARYAPDGADVKDARALFDRFRAAFAKVPARRAADADA